MRRVNYVPSRSAAASLTRRGSQVAVLLFPRTLYFVNCAQLLSRERSGSRCTSTRGNLFKVLFPSSFFFFLNYQLFLTTSIVRSSVNRSISFHHRWTFVNFAATSRSSLWIVELSQSFVGGLEDAAAQCKNTECILNRVE